MIFIRFLNREVGLCVIGKERFSRVENSFLSMSEGLALLLTLCSMFKIIERFRNP